MKTFILLFVVSASASLILTPIVRRVSEQIGWLDQPRDSRRIHVKAVPRTGGIAIYISILIGVIVFLIINNSSGRSLVDWPQLLIIFGPATLIFLLGVYDDLRGVNAVFKFTAQGLAGAVLYLAGGRIEAISVPFIGSVDLPWVLGFCLTVGWTTIVTNAFNLIDGMDGLAAGAALFASLVLLAVSLVTGNLLVIVTTLALVGALVGFLRYNFNPASIFLGDSGSLFVGFMLAVLSLQGTQKAPTAVAIAIPLMAFGLPIIDTSFSIVRRFVGGRPIFQGDREHIHHMLLARGWSQRRVAIVLYGVCAIFGMLALLFVNDTGHERGLVLFIVGVAVVVAVGHLRYHEVDEFKASMRRNLAESRLRLANNIRIRRASRALSQANTLGELFSAIQEMLELGEFVYATAQIGRGGDDARNRLALLHEKGAPSLRGSEIRRGLICWSWERGDIGGAEVQGSPRFWSLRLPLSTDHAGWGYINLYREFENSTLPLDINYLCSLFQLEMAQAVERVLLGKGEMGREQVLRVTPSVREALSLRSGAGR